MSKKSELIQLIANTLQLLYPDKIHPERDASIIVKILMKHPDLLEILIPMKKFNQTHHNGD